MLTAWPHPNSIDIAPQGLQLYLKKDTGDSDTGVCL